MCGLARSTRDRGMVILVVYGPRLPTLVLAGAIWGAAVLAFGARPSSARAASVGQLLMSNASATRSRISDSVTRLAGVLEP